MTKNAAQAMTYERTDLIKPVRPNKAVGRVSRAWAVKDTTKHLERLSSPHIVWYLLKRHHEFFVWVGFGFVWFIIGLAA